MCRHLSKKVTQIHGLLASELGLILNEWSFCKGGQDSSSTPPIWPEAVLALCRSQWNEVLILQKVTFIFSVSCGKEVVQDKKYITFYLGPLGSWSGSSLARLMEVWNQIPLWTEKLSPVAQKAHIWKRKCASIRKGICNQYMFMKFLQHGFAEHFSRPDFAFLWEGRWKSHAIGMSSKPALTFLLLWWQRWDMDLPLLALLT